MPMNWPWAKQFVVKCPDGTPRYIHKNVDDAFPLFLKERSSNAKASIDALDHAKADVAKDQKDTIGYILFRIDDKNSSMQASFRAAYIVYAASPCTKSDYLQQAVESIRKEEQNLRSAEMAITNIINAIINTSSAAIKDDHRELLNHQLLSVLKIVGHNQNAIEIAQQMSAVPNRTLEWSQS